MMYLQRFRVTKSGWLAIPALLLMVVVACMRLPWSAPPPPEYKPPTPTAASTQAPVTPQVNPGQTFPGSADPATANPEADARLSAGSVVQILLIQHRGTLTRIGCCNPLLYERDEFVVIQNRGDMPQDINDWRLLNITKGYPTFRFPSLFPCIPYTVPAVDEQNAPESTYTVVHNPAQSEINRLSQQPQTEKPVNQPAGEINWSSCAPLEPPDQTPMKPAKGQQGKPALCILYPGQTILVFTDEVHCSSGGFSFNYGSGNIWNNEKPDTAVLYNARGEEVSRRSYMVGR